MELRKAKKMTQKDLANVMNVTLQAVSKWERDEGNPDIQILLGKMKGGITMSNNNIVDKLTTDVVVDQNDRKKVFVFEITMVLPMEQATPHTQFLVRKLSAMMREKNKNIDVRAYTSALIDKLGGQADVILLAPNFSYAKEEIEGKFSDTPVIPISQKDYGIANVEKIYNNILEKLNC